MASGWIKLYRQLMDSDIWEDKTASRLFIVLLLLADREGIVTRSIQDLADLCRTPKTTCNDALYRTVAYGIANAKPNGKKMAIRILKWNDYQAHSERLTERYAERRPNDDRTMTPVYKKERKKEDKEIILSIADGDLINKIIKIFGSINPSYDQLFKRKTQREAAERLSKKYSVEQITTMVEAARQANGQPFAPTITTPCQLEDKLGQLKSFYDKNNQKGVKVWKA